MDMVNAALAFVPIMDRNGGDSLPTTGLAKNRPGATQRR
ncbi:hypothetical protein SFOMI_0095 [Sphingobium fuliginis]|uniref:Uncharacterized protein n=1 Tax=Sphingobium fuliginis (strain ATCC 27551) TaxID=336203 RepID=A0A292Z927_SPHSA|nr:hypothetical protein SFOMI_0095 [Sphingobium fuliginis]